MEEEVALGIECEETEEGPDEELFPEVREAGGRYDEV